MIGRQNRFHGPGALNYVYRKGRVVRTAYCSLRYVPNSRRQTYRLAVVVSRKVHKSAVIRNRIRRRLYEQVRLGLDREVAYDIVLTPHSDQLAIMSEKHINKIISELLQVLTATSSKNIRSNNTVDKSNKAD